MALNRAPWEKYLSDTAKIMNPSRGGAGALGIDTGIDYSAVDTVESRRLAGQPDLAQAKKKFEAQQLVAGSLGAEGADEPRKGVLMKALDVITFLPAVATAAVKEFVVDPIYQVAYAVQDAGLTEAERAAAKDRERVSVQEFMNNVRERNFAQEMYGFLNYEEDASILEKAAKEITGFGIDIASTGGFGGGVRLFGALGTLGRRRAASTVANASSDVFRKRATKFADETDSQFESRAKDFGTKAGVEYAKGPRTRGIKNVFEREFGEELGKDIFLNELPKEVQGGVQLLFRGRTVASLNRGGYVVDALGRGLGLPQLGAKTGDAIEKFQRMKNVLRADELKVPGVAAVVGRINGVLNSIGRNEAKVWQSFLRATVRNAKDEDIQTAFKGFEAVSDLNSYRTLRGKVVEPTNNFFADIVRLEKSSPEDYKLAIEFMRNPARALAADANDPINERALQFATQYRDDFDRYYKLLIANGFDVDYQANFLPLMYVKIEDQDVMARALGVGPKNIPGPGYRPEMARLRFMKDKIDPVTKQVVRDADGQVVQIPMLPYEIKEMFIRMGRKDLADMIEDDPLVLLGRYSTNVSRLLSGKAIINSIRARNVLFKSTALQYYPDQGALQRAISTMTPNEVDNIIGDFIGDPGAMSRYFESLNDDLAKAYSSGDEAAIEQVKAQVQAFMASLTSLDKAIYKKIMTIRKPIREGQIKEDEEAFAAINAQVGDLAVKQESLLREKERLGRLLGGEAKDTDLQPRTVADVLAGREGITYRPVGSSDALARESFYLPKELADLTGEEALVESIDRVLLLAKGDRKAQTELGKSLDSYLQFFRVGATFGRLTGFVLRNGYGAVQNNIVIAGSTATDHKLAGEIAKARVITDIALQPLAQLSRADLATKRVDKLLAAGRLTEAQAKKIRDDIDRLGIVKVETVGEIREEVLEGILGQKVIRDGVTQWDAYKTAVDGGIFDRYVILPASQGLNADDAAVSLLGIDPSRIVMRTDKAGKERSISQRIGEGILNFGTTISADVGGRTINLRPVQLTRDLNQLLEEFVRIAPIVTGLRRYGADKGGAANAIMLMKAAQFDYSDLSDVERRIFRRLLPFWTYMKGNLSAQTRVLMNDPERIRRNLAGWEVVGNIFSDENGENYVIPDYVGEMMGFLIDDDIRKEVLKRSPGWLQNIMQNPLAFRPESPVLDLERYTRGGFMEGTVEELISSANPAAKAVLQVALNENLFSGKEYDAEGEPAPNWYIGINNLIKSATGGSIDLGVRRNDKTGELVANGAIIDAIKTVLPQVGTLERTAIPFLDAAIEAATGEETDLAGSMSDRAITNLLSQLGGINVVTITPDVEEGVYKERERNVKNVIAGIAMEQGIDREKLRELVYRLRDQGYSKEEIFGIVEEARQAGQLAYVVAP
jgi:hypothetical protein